MKIKSKEITKDIIMVALLGFILSFTGCQENMFKPYKEKRRGRTS